jgi:YfiH family protein
MMDLKWPLIAGVHAVCSTRHGGVSSAPFASLNLGDHVGDLPESVAQNRSLLAQHLLGATPVFLQQVHGTDVANLTQATPNGLAFDAACTTQPNIACTIMVADCLPVLFVDDQGKAVAAAHAGWRGLAQGVLEKTAQAVCQAAQCDAAALHVWLGPCIGDQAFEVGSDVYWAFVNQHPQAAQFFKPRSGVPDKWLANLSGLARWRLNLLGVKDVAGNDASPEWCTVQQSSKFFSFRRDGVTGRFAACIWRSA